MGIRNMINEVGSLRGTEVLEFGQPKQMKAEFDPLVIDTVDILNQLEEYEVRDFVGIDNETLEEVDFDGLDGYLDYIENNHGIKQLLHSNTFNESSPVSNHIDFEAFEFEDGFMGDKVFVEMKTQLGYGDVRTHYTDSVLLKFESIDHFYEAFHDAGRKEVEFVIDGNEFTAHVSALDSNIEVFEYGTQILDYNDFPELDSLKATVAEELDLSLQGNEVGDLIEEIENGEVEVEGVPEYERINGKDYLKYTLIDEGIDVYYSKKEEYIRLKEEFEEVFGYEPSDASMEFNKYLEIASFPTNETSDVYDFDKVAGYKQVDELTSDIEWKKESSVSKESEFVRE